MISCSTDDDPQELEYEFIAEYRTDVLVGGIVGVRERIFEIGEVYSSIEEEENTITIRIAEHSELNEDCPNSWCYQEFLNVPREFLSLLE
ncbi:hypothetical protein [Mesonia mobilis]|uniref:hypothetical protein n=1 Tax=Mesonia mobilis TaxID=369791 RepID=UPI0026E97215|nr:hypothetical protein [Mesonia mobilis]